MPASGRYTRSSRFRVHGEAIRPEGERQRRHSVVGGDTTVDVASIMTQLEIARKARVITLPPPPESTCFGYTRDRFVCLCALSIVNLLSNSVFSIMAPFFPQFGAAHGLSEFQVSVIFAMFALVQFVVAPFVGARVLRLGRRRVLFLGEFLNAIATISFGCLYLVPDGTPMLAIAIVIRSVQGVGVAFSETGSFSIVASDFTSNTGTTIGILETFGGLGLMAGSPIGGFLYQAGGFRLPFFTTGSALLLLLPLLYVYIRPDVNSTGDTNDDAYDADAQTELSPTSLALRQPIVWCLLCGGVFNYAAFSFLEPTLSSAVEARYGVSPGTVGLLFLAQSLSYAIMSPIAGLISDRIGAPLTLTMGFSLMALGLALIGPLPPLMSFLPPSVGIPAVALVIIGIGGALGMVPILPAMMHILTTRFRLNQEAPLTAAQLEKQRLHSHTMHVHGRSATVTLSGRFPRDILHHDLLHSPAGRTLIPAHDPHTDANCTTSSHVLTQPPSPIPHASNDELFYDDDDDDDDDDNDEYNVTVNVIPYTAADTQSLYSTRSAPPTFASPSLTPAGADAHSANDDSTPASTTPTTRTTTPQPPGNNSNNRGSDDCDDHADTDDTLTRQAEAVYSVLGGLLSSATSLGSILGPIAGGLLVQLRSFAFASEVFFGSLCVYTLALVVSFLVVAHTLRRAAARVNAHSSAGDTAPTPQQHTKLVINDESSPLMQSS